MTSAPNQDGVNPLEDGKINRLQFAISFLICLVVAVACELWVAQGVGILLYFIVMLVLQAGRLRDIGWSRLWVIVTIIPVAGNILLLFCLFYPSKKTSV